MDALLVSQGFIENGSRDFAGTNTAGGKGD